MAELHARLLERAAEILGGPDALAAYLGVAPSHVRIWMRGLLSPPTEVFLKLVDLVIEPPAVKPGHVRHAQTGK